MKIFGYLEQILTKIEEEGFEAYIVGKAVFLHLLERPIEEYDVITSAPFFSFSKNKSNHKRIIDILEYDKPIHIHLCMDKKRYYKGCCYRLETLLYHPKHGLIDEYHALDDLEKRKLTVLNQTLLDENPLYLLDGLTYKAFYNFKLEKWLETILATKKNLLKNVKKRSINQYLSTFLSLDQPGKFFLEYENLFSELFLVNDFQMRLLDYTKNNLILRLTVLYCKEDIVLAEKELREYGYSKDMKDRIIHLLEYQNVSLTQENAKDFIGQFKNKDIKLWFYLKRAKLLANHEIAYLPKIDELEKEVEELAKKRMDLVVEDLKIKAEDLLLFGYKKEQIPFLLAYLLKKIKEEALYNDYENLKAYVERIFPKDE